MTEYKYTIYLYTNKDYGTTGISLTTKQAAVDKVLELKKLNDLSYGVFVEFNEDGVYHRRLLWKDGEDVIRNYSKKLSFSAQTMLTYIIGFVRQYQRVPTFDEIKNEIQKRDYDIHRVFNILEEAGKIEISKPFRKNTPFKLKK